MSKQDMETTIETTMDKTVDTPDGVLEILECSTGSIYRQVYGDNDHLLESPTLKGFRNCIPLRARILKIGRQDAEFLITHPGISAVHFIVWQVSFDKNTDPLYYLKDNSLNGTYVNGHLVGKNMIRVLNEGDIITIPFAIKLKFSQALGKGSSDRSGVHLLNSHPKVNWEISTKVIGHGSFGSIYVASRKNDKSKHYAVKILRCQTQLNQMPRIKQEADILFKLNHPNIIKVYQALVVKEHFYIFEDLVCGGDLFSYLTNGLSLRAIPETEAIIISFQLLKALDYLHQQGIVHRDLKLDNVLLVAPMPGTRIVLCDFGIAKMLPKPHRRTNTIVGTVEYAAPEIFSPIFPGQISGDDMGYDSKCDIWSLGVMVHLMLSGISPFYADNDSNIIQSAAKGTLHFDRPQWTKVGNMAKSFVKRALNPRVSERLNVKQCFDHPWFARNIDELNKIYEKIIEK